MATLDIFNDKEFKETIKKFDKILKSVPDFNTINDSDALVSQAIKQATLDDKDKFDDIFENIVNDLNINNNRTQRYSSYDEVYHSVQLVKKIVKVYLNNILLRDPITNVILKIKTSKELQSKGDVTEYVNFCKSFLKFFKFEEKLKNRVIPNILKYGDYFVEIVDVEKTKIHISKNKKSEILSESEFIQKLNTTNSYNLIKPLDFVNVIENYVEFEELIDDQIDIVESKSEFKIDNSKNEDVTHTSPYNFSKIALKFNKPHNIFPLITEFDNVIGYLEILENYNVEHTTKNSLSPTVNFSNIVNQISTSTFSQTNSKFSSKDNIVKLFVDALILKLLKKYKINTDSSQNELHESLKKNLKNDLYFTLKKLLLSSNNKNLFKGKLKIRFILPENMFHFKCDPGSGEFFPFNLGILDTLVFPGKLFILHTLSSIVNRWTRSSLYRKWTIETGGKEDTTSLIQNFKKKLLNERVTAQELLETKNISKILSDFRDFIVFKKKGQSYIDVDMMNPNNNDVYNREIDDLRKEIISLSGVPAQYLGYDGGPISDVRDQIVNTNILFANDISSIQKEINNNVTQLISRVSQIVNFKPSYDIEESVSINLNAPTNLTVQSTEATINSVTNIVRLFAEIPEVSISPLYLLKHYVIGSIDWDEFTRASDEYKVKSDIEKNLAGNNQQPTSPGY